jgi:uncharacterized protein YjbI with pentapeptide repeats
MAGRFTLRTADATSNPVLPELRGFGETHGIPAWWDYVDGRKKFILLLCRGIADGLEWYEYGGLRLPMYDPNTGQGNWVFHPGILTSRPDPAHPATTGFNDPLQGRPTFFPELDFCFSGIAYVEVWLPADVSGDAETPPEESQIKMRGLRIRDYLPDGTEMVGPGLDSDGNALWQIPGEGVWVSFTCNPARHAADAMRQGLLFSTVQDRNHWATWTQFRARCATAPGQGIPWEGGGGNGLLASYFNNDTLAGAPVAQVIETVLDKKLSYTSPGVSGLGTEHYTIRFTGQVEAPADGPLTFYSTHDDAARLWVGGVQLVDDWVPGAARTRQGTYPNAVKGQRLDITYEYWQFQTFGELRLEWEAAGVGRQVIPQAAMFSSAAVAASARLVPRYETDIAHTQPTSAAQVLENILLFCPGVEWQKVSGRYKWLTDPAREPVYHFVWDDTQPLPAIPSNIVRDSFQGQRRDPTMTPNYLRGSFRDKERDLFDLAWVQTDRPERRRLQRGRNYSPQPLTMGVCRQSLAQRVLETQAVLNIDLDLQLVLRGLPMCYRVAKGDLVRVTHNVPKWRVYGPVLIFMVVKESFDSVIDSADERSFVLRLHHPLYYSDTSHGPLQRYLGGGDTPSRHEPPPPVLAADNPDPLQEVKTRDTSGRVVSSISGNFQLDRQYPHDIYAWVWWKRPGALDYTPWVRLRAADGTRQISFALTPAEAGQHFVRVVPETALGRKWPTDEHPVFSLTTTGDTERPVEPPSGTGTYDGAGGISLTWVDSPSPNRNYYEVRWADAGDGGLGTLIQSVVRRPWTLPVIAGLGSYDVRVYTVGSNGLRSLSSLPIHADVPATPAPGTGQYTLAFINGTTIRHRVQPPAALTTYDFGSNGAAALVQATAGLWDEEAFTFTAGQRSFTRYARAVRHGITSAWVSAVLNVPAPAAPTIARDTSFSFPSSFVVRVTGPTDPEARKQIRATVVQVYSNAACTVPVGAPQRYDGVEETVRVDGRQSVRPQVWVRAWFEDLFGPGAVSNIDTGTFEQFLGSDIGPGVIGDSHLDPNSNLTRRITGQNAYPLMATGTLVWDGTTFTLGNRVLALPVPRTVSAAGYFNFGATGAASAYNLGTGAVASGWAALIWRVQVGGAGGDADNHAYVAGTDKGWFVADYNTYTAATPASGRMDFCLAVRNSVTGSLHLWNNLVLQPSGQPVPAGGVLQQQSVTQLLLALSAVGPNQLASGAVTAGKIADSAIDAVSKFAGGLQPLKSVSALPALPDATVPDAVLLLTDYKLYRKGPANTWTRATDGADITADSIFGSSLKVGTVSAREIGAEAVRTVNLFVGNFDNLAEDPGFERAGAATQWSLGAGMVVSTGLQRSGSYYLNAAAAGQTALNSNFADCAPGQQFYAEGFVKATGGGYGGVCIAWYDRARNFVSQTLATLPLGSADAAGWQRSVLIATAPAGASFARCGYFTGAGQTPGWFFDDIYFRRVMDGAIIADATIQYAKIAQAHLELVTIDSALVNRAIIDWLAVREANIVDASIINAKIANAAIDYAKIQNAVLESVFIGGANVNRAFIDWLGVREANIVDATITRAKIGLLAVDNARMADASIDIAKILRLDVGTFTPWDPVTQTGSGIRLDPSGLYINTSTAATIQGTPFTVVQVRSINAISQYLTWRGRDTRTLDTTKRTFYGRVNTEWNREEEAVRWRVFCNFDGLLNVTSNTTDIHGDSLKWCRYEVFNKFGERVDYDYWPYQGRGIAFETQHTRRYAEPDDEVVAKMTFWNALGWTPDADALWLHQNQQMSYVAPAWRARADCPLDLAAVTRSSSEVALNWQWGGAARAVWARTLEGGTSGWFDVTAQCTGDRVQSCVVGGLSPWTRYEFRTNDGTANAQGNNSNIVYARTFPAVTAPPAGSPVPRYAPSTPQGVALSTATVRFTWTRNSTDNTIVDYRIDYGAGFGAWTDGGDAARESLDVGGLAASQTVRVEVRNRWADGDTKESETGQATSSAAPVSNTNASGLTVTGNLHNTLKARATFAWQMNGGVGPTLWLRDISAGTAAVAVAPTGATTHDTGYTLNQGHDYDAWVTTSNGTAESNHAPFTTEVYIPPYQDDPWCVAPETRIELAAGSATAEALLALYRAGRPLPEVLWHTPAGVRVLLEVACVTEGTAPGLWTLRAAGGRTLRCSPSHPVIRHAGDTTGTPAEQLAEGDCVLTREGVRRLRSLEYAGGEARVICLSLRGADHRFWSDGIASHNIKPRNTL